MAADTHGNANVLNFNRS